MFGASHELAVIEVFSCVRVVDELDSFSWVVSSGAHSLAVEDLCSAILGRA